MEAMLLQISLQTRQKKLQAFQLRGLLLSIQENASKANLIVLAQVQSTLKY